MSDELEQRIARLEIELAQQSELLAGEARKRNELEAIAKDEIVKMFNRVKHLDYAVAEIQDALWPVVEKIYPDFFKDLKRADELLTKKQMPGRDGGDEKP